MSPPMSASTLKLKRARTHLAELGRIVQQYIESNPIKYDTSIEEPEIIETLPNGRKRVRAVINFNFQQTAIPEETSAVLGDIIHNLRAALDLMATEICHAGDDPEDQTHFPFAKREEDFEKRLKDTGFERAGPDALALIRELKPYPGGNDLLRAIHDLDIRDKHKRLIIQGLSHSTPTVDLGPQGSRHPIPKIIGDPTKPSDLRVYFPPDCSLAKHELISTLEQMVEMTAGIIESFKLLRTPPG